MADVAANVEVYADIATTEEVDVVPRVVTQSEQVARYFIEDLERFVQETHLDLVKELDVPVEEGYSTKDLLFMLFEDISHMIRDRIITRIRLILSESAMDKNIQGGAYPIRYQATYVIDIPERTLRDMATDNRQRAGQQSDGNGEQEAQRINGYLAVPRRIWVGAKFALLIDWNPSASEKRRSARRPQYCFDWCPAPEEYDDTTVIRFRSGGMAYGGAMIVRRDEVKAIGYKE